MILPIFQGSSKEAVVWKRRHWKMGTSRRGSSQMTEQLRASPSLFPRRLCFVWGGKVLSGEDPLPAQASERCLNRALRAPSASLPRGLFPPSCPPEEALWVKAIISRKFLLIACSRLMGPYHITTFSGMNHTGCLKLGP